MSGPQSLYTAIILASALVRALSIFIAIYIVRNVTASLLPTARPITSCGNRSSRLRASITICITSGSNRRRLSGAISSSGSSAIATSAALTATRPPMAENSAAVAVTHVLPVAAATATRSNNPRRA